MASLNTRAWLSVAMLGAIMALLLFVAAGTLRYWQAWIYLAIFIGATTLTTADLMRRDAALLQRRMKGGPLAETRPAQRLIMLWALICFVALLVVPALDRRFDWSVVPFVGSVAGDVLVALGFCLIFRVYRENTFTAATIEVASDQKVVSTGPYAIVRHPMYAGGSLYIFGTPLGLGSWWGLVPIAVMMPVLIWRLIDEERMLAHSLLGYVEYQKRVRYRLVPFLW
jgi:protein-S-isoprenylcysteine O-methyltransferase Ste14